MVLILKGIPAIISPDMMKTLMEMGHSDEIVLADANFPAVTCAKRLIRSDGNKLTLLLEAILPFFPLDKTVEHPVVLMEANADQVPSIWDEYRSIIRKFEPTVTEFEHMERYKYYERAKNAFAVIVSGDIVFRGNIILKKGVVKN